MRISLYLTSFFILVTGCVFLFTKILGTQHYQYAAISSIATCLLIYYLINQAISFKSSHKNTQIPEQKSGSFFDLIAEIIFIPYSFIKHRLYDRKIIWVIILILSVMVLSNIYNLEIVLSKVDLSDITEEVNFDVLSVSFYSGIFGIIFAQIGGWFFQTILIYLFLIFIGKSPSFNFYLKGTGIAYVGFMLSSLTVMLYNMLFLGNFDNMDDFTRYMNNSYLYILLGKAGELWTSILISRVIYLKESVTPYMSLLASFLPNLLLLASILFFRSMLL